MNKYNYVILGSDWDLYKFSYSDLFDLPNVRYISSPFPPSNTIKGVLYRIHFNPKINGIVNLPGKQLWNSSYFKMSFSDDRPVCFIVFSSWIELNVGIVRFIRTHYPKAKLICMMQDLVSTKKLKFTYKSFDPLSLNRDFDLVLSFDQGDCAKYGYVYHPLVFSEYKGVRKEMSPSDVYMLAKAKNRLQEIYGVYDRLIDAGLSVDLLLLGVAGKDRRLNSNISYIDGKGISYEENIQHILNSKCILEVMQAGGQGYTQRGCEAVCLGRKLLTNNPLIKKAPFFTPTYISTFKTVQDLDMDFLKRIKSENDAIDYHYKDKMSPIELLDFIEERI